MIPYEQHLLPPNAEPLEQALSTTTARLDAIAVPISDLWDPWTCPEPHLPWLANALGVDIWRDEWPIERKREVVSRALILKSLKGRPAGYREYVSYADGEVVDMVRPPADFFWGAENEQSIADWMQSLPQIRIYPFSLPGVGNGFYGGDFFDDDGDVSVRPVGLSPFLTESTAADERGRRAVLFDNFSKNPSCLDVETEIPLIRELSLREGFVEFEEYSVSTPVSEIVLFNDDGFGEDFLSDEDAACSVVCVQPGDRGSVLTAGERLVRRDPEYSQDDQTPSCAEWRALYAGDGHMGREFYLEDMAPYSTFERYYLYRPQNDAGDPDSSRGYYNQGMRYGIERATTEISVSLPETIPFGTGFLTTDFLHDSYYAGADLEDYWFMVDAVATARAFRDKPLIDTQILRNTRLTDRPKLGLRLGEKVRSF